MFDVQQRDGATVIYVQADLDIATREAFETVVSTAASGDNRVVVSLEDCPYCDSTALGVLAKTKREIGSRLKIAVPTDHRMRRLFEITNLTDYFRLLPTVEDALRAP